MVEQGLYTGLVGRESADEKHGRPPNVIILGLYHWQQNGHHVESISIQWNRCCQVTDPLHRYYY